MPNGDPRWKLFSYIMEKKDSVFLAGFLTALMFFMTSDRFTGEDGANLQKQQNTLLHRVQRLEDIYEKMPPATVADTLESVKVRLHEMEIIIGDMRALIGRIEGRLEAERDLRHFDLGGTSGRSGVEAGLSGADFRRSSPSAGESRDGAR